MTRLIAIPHSSSPREDRSHHNAAASRKSRAERQSEAFTRLYREHYRQITGYLYRRTGRQDIAEDLAADTFTDAYRVFWRYRTTGAPISSWFFRIATNKANAWLRRVKRGEIPPPQPTVDPEQTALQRERAEALYEALHKLPPEQQAVIALARFESLSHQEVAIALGVRIGTVKSRLNRAIESLRQELEFLEGEP